MRKLKKNYNMGPNFPISRKLKHFKKFNSILYFFNPKNIINKLNQQKYLYSFLNFIFQNLIISKPIISYKNNQLYIKLFYFFVPELNQQNKNSIKKIRHREMSRNLRQRQLPSHLMMATVPKNIKFRLTSSKQVGLQNDTG